MLAMARATLPTLPSSCGRTRTTAGCRRSRCESKTIRATVSRAALLIPWAGRAADSPRHERADDAMNAYLVFSGSGPILLLSSYATLEDPRLLARLRAKGIEKFLADEVSLAAVRARYRETFAAIAEDLADSADARVLDSNGHQIPSNFSLRELGAPHFHEGQ
jgi:hypothetical protein